MTSTAPAGASGATTVIVHCGGDAQPVVERRLQQLVESAPRDVAVVATVLRPLRLRAALARRVRVVRISIADGGMALVGQEVARDQAVVVVPFTASVSGSWLTTALRRAAEQPQRIGTFACGRDHLMTYPREVTALDAPQSPWAALEGVTTRARPVPRAGTSAQSSHQSLSAVLIVKDEEEVLDECLAALAPLVDEVVVYDTGSTDRTLEIARARGALVVEGYWNDDFGDARNRALAHASSDWVLSVDADEVVEAEDAVLRAWIDTIDSDHALVRIVSTAWKGAGSGDESRSTRLFRRAVAQWRGALHEQVVARPGQPGLRSTPQVAPMLLQHSGYAVVSVKGKDKAQRNRSIAGAAWASVDRSDPRWPEMTADYGRSLAMSAELDECLAVLGELLITPSSPGNMVQAARVAIPLLLTARRYTDLEAWLAAADRHGEAPGQLTMWRAGVAMAQGRLQDAESLVDGLDAPGSTMGGQDLWGREFDVTGATTLRAELDRFLGRPQSAAERMLGLLQHSPETVNVQLLFDALGDVGATMGDLIRQAPPAFLDRSLRQMASVSPQVALPWFAAFAAAHPQDFRPVVAGCAVAARAGWVDALEWSVRAREAGLSAVCALRDLAQQQERSRIERCLAWAVLGHGLQDADALDELPRALGELAPGEHDLVVSALDDVVPGLSAQLPAVGDGTGVAHEVPAPA